MKNKLKYVIEFIVIFFCVLVLILFLQNIYFSVKTKLIALDVILILICIKYKKFSLIQKDEKRNHFKIRWFGLILIAILLTIGILIYEK